MWLCLLIYFIEVCSAIQLLNQIYLHTHMFFWLHCWRRMARLWKYAYWLLLPNFQDDWAVGHNSKKQFSSSRNCTGTPGSFDLFLPGGQLTLELPRYLRYNPSTVTYIYTCPIYIDWDCWMDGQTDRHTDMHACLSFMHPSCHPSIPTLHVCVKMAFIL